MKKMNRVVLRVYRSKVLVRLSLVEEKIKMGKMDNSNWLLIIKMREGMVMVIKIEMMNLKEHLMKLIKMKKMKLIKMKKIYKTQIISMIMKQLNN